MAAKRKKIPFHIAHNLKEYRLPVDSFHEEKHRGIRFFARDDADALLYAKKVGGGYAKLGTDGKYFHEKGDEY